jgi:hypothetical protein
MAETTAISCGKCGGATLPAKGMSYCIGCDWYTNWPPTEAHAAVWAKVQTLELSDIELCQLTDLLTWWMDETSTLVAYQDDDGEWHDVEWPWSGDGPPPS